LGYGLILGAASLCWTSSASAWSARAHTMVGDIASALLTPDATLAVDDLLRDDLGVDGQPSGYSTLGQVANWPDLYRATAAGKPTGVYHFDDIPICGEPDRAKYCRDGQCATAWIAKQIAVLKDASQPPRARNEALKWIVHLVGDLHQPLHASDDDDQGGNTVKVTFLGKAADDPVDGRTSYPYNLHTAWDRLIPYRAFDRAGGLERFLADMPSAETIADWQVGTIDQWTMESHALAVEYVYPAMPIAFSCGTAIKVVVPLDARYDEMGEIIATQQIRKAGVRLAKVLNDIFRKP
jgi:hypothetical protein